MNILILFHLILTLSVFFITECIYGTTIWNCGWWHGEGAVEYFRINYIFLSVTAHTDSPCVIFFTPVYICVLNNPAFMLQNIYFHPVLCKVFIFSSYQTKLSIFKILPSKSKPQSLQPRPLHRMFFPLHKATWWVPREEQVLLTLRCSWY